eukprot:CAMPEP_0177738646 /NCGR_PEP_ID=MMETSP0484_2-20121128/26567_1 /TAXON_ID=354590 /ORGANISM="Rhodomonas lens, Strain RHODO" /LENGTH=59 /DNA_ID=CAMNT_0019252583 /DNA_START=40 /DNA_END=215 /DNA_ORIENTATION=+
MNNRARPGQQEQDASLQRIIRDSASLQEMPSHWSTERGLLTSADLIQHVMRFPDVEPKP